MMDLYEAAIATRGTAFGANVSFCGVSTDSRKIGAGELFVALAGENFDGHDYVARARDLGAVAALVDNARAEALLGTGVPLLAVEETRQALGRLAAYWRRKFALPLIAVTGSNGKTTVKEMIAGILRAQAVLDGYDPDLAVLATRGNLNNDIGLPLTLLKLHATNRAAVVEMGMNHPGEIAYLVGIAAPTVSLVNNAQRAHIEGMGSLASVAREKGEIIANAPLDAVAVLNADDPNADIWRAAAGSRRVVAFGLDNPAADVRGVCREDGFVSHLELLHGDHRTTVLLQAPGRHNARNAVAAAAATLAAGLPLVAVQAGLNAFRGVKGRLQRTPAAGGALLIDDTYNANPDSVRAGLEVLARADGQRFLVFGDMGEIGTDSEAYHEEIGEFARRLGIERLFTLGRTSAYAARGFGPGAQHFTEIGDLLEALIPLLTPATTVLVKGSRFMRMERVVEVLRAPQAGEKH